MCVHFFNFDHLRIKLQSSDFFRGTKFHALLFLSLHSSSSTFKLLSMASYGGELLLDSSSTWSGISIHLSPSPFHCNQTSRSKGIHWWRRFRAYKLHMELHHFLSTLLCLSLELSLYSSIVSNHKTTKLLVCYWSIWSFIHSC